jgi:TRAP-type C4-dicarboxylate transport system permease small subunit
MAADSFASPDLQFHSPEPARARGPLVKIGDAIATVTLWLSASALLVIVAINFANVVGRYFFRSPISWAEEAMLHLMIAAVFLGAVSIAWQRRHIRIDAFITLAPRRLGALLEIFATLLSIGVLTYLSYIAAGVASLMHQIEQRTDALEIPMWLPHTIVTASLCLIVLLMVLRLLSLRRLENAAPDERSGLH